MPGPIFMHIQTFARKENPGGQSVAQVIGEGLREPKFSRHVDSPKPPRVLFGHPSTFAVDHDAHVAAREVEVKTKCKGTRRRAIRVDRHTMATVIASYPLTWDQIETRPDGRERLAEWEAATLTWIRERWGEQVCTVFAHDDEAHPHMHAWLLPDDPGAQAATLHPGKVAKAAEEERAKREGVSKPEAVALGNRALKDAMRTFLDDYWQDVGITCGMTRDGPRRGRLTRAEALARKAEVERMRLARRAAKEEADAARELSAAAQRAAEEARAQRVAAAEAAAQVQADRQALGEEKEALAVVTEQIEDGIALAVELVADGSLRVVNGKVRVPPEHHAALRPVWPMIDRPMRQLVGLRNRWTAGLSRLRALFRRNEMVAELRDEARQILEDDLRQR